MIEVGKIEVAGSWSLSTRSPLMLIECSEVKQSTIGVRLSSMAGSMSQSVSKFGAALKGHETRYSSPMDPLLRRHAISAFFFG